MFPHGLTLQVTWTRGERRISPRTATIAWTRVHAIIKSARAKKREFKWMRSMAYLLPRGASPERPIAITGSLDSSHRMVAIFRNWAHYAIIAGSSDSSHRTAVITGNLGDGWSLPVRPILIEWTALRSRSSSRSSSIGRRRQHVEEPTIAVRSSRDRGAIEPRSQFFPWGIVSNRSAGD